MNAVNTIEMREVSIAEMVDQIGELDAAIKALQSQRENAAAAVKALGAGKYAGELWSATVIESVRSSTDWRAIAERLNPSRQLVVAHTTTTPVITLKVTGLK